MILARRERRGALFIILALALTGLALLLSRGTAGGDEGEAVIFALVAHHDGWRAALARPDAWILGHRFVWMLEKYLLNWSFSHILPASIYGKPIIRFALLTIDGSLFMLASVAAGIRYLIARGFSWSVASLAIAALLIASSAISFFAGGVVEAMMCLLVVLITSEIENGGDQSRARSARLLLYFALLIFIKPYSVLVLLPLCLLIPGSGRRLGFAAGIVACAFAFTLFLGSIGSHGSALGFLVSLMSFDVGALSQRMIGFFFSLPFGLLWCFPFLLLIALAWPVAARTILAKAGGIVLLALFLSLYAFSYGAGAVAGPRYVVPFLLLFLPEIAIGVTVLRRQWSWGLFAIPLTAMLFLPSLDYRNSLVGRWASAANLDTAWPDGDLSLQPGIFAWRIELAKQAGTPKVRISRDLPYVVETRAIFPMSGISRVIAILDNEITLPDQQAKLVRNELAYIGLGHIWVWQMLRWLLVAGLMAWLFAAALCAQPRRAPFAIRSLSA